MWFTLFDTENIDPMKLKNVMGRLRKNTSGNYSFFVTHADNTTFFDLKANKNTYDLDVYLAPVGEPEPYSQITEVTNVLSEKSGSVQLELTMVFFAFTQNMDDVNVALDERIIETAEKKMRLNAANSAKVDVLGQFLLEHCVIKIDQDNYYLIYAGEDDDTDDEETQAGNETPSPFAFAICGDQVKIAVEKRTGKDNEVYFAAKRITFKNALNGESGLRLIRGNLSFFDWTKGGKKMSAIQMEILNKIAESPHSYLKIWDEYVKAEGNKIFKEARDFDSIQCLDKRQISEDTWNIFLDDAESPLPKELKAAKDVSVEFVDKKPVYLENKNMDWAEYLNQEKNQEKIIKHEPSTVISCNENIVTVKCKGKPSGKFMILSIQGEKSIYTRRKNARDAILQGRSAMSDLGILIEDKAEYTPRRARQHEIALTPYIREKVFKGNERPNQEEAVDIAINTPDICLIQGPPGTGKTTVITAIIERLNEIYGKTDDIAGRVLISSSQHDAVENLAERLKINSLPAIKFGRKTENYLMAFSKWQKELAEKIDAIHHDDISQSIEQQEIHAAFTIYQESPSTVQAIELLKKIRALSQVILDDDIIARIETIQASLEEERQEPEADLIRKIRSLRVSKAAFNDDGPAQAMNLYNTLEERQELDESKEAILKKAAMWDRDRGDITFLKELGGLKRDLLLRYLPKPQYRIDKERFDILELINDVDRLLEKSKKFEDKKKAAVAAFLNELNNDSIEIRTALKDYSVVYASTVNFAGSDTMAKVKNASAKGSIIYDTVVVDEAARTNPPDLLISLNQAKTRIILVGDDRQLPQLTEEDLVKEALENSALDMRKEMDGKLQDSMFAYLKKRIKQIEKNDGIKRYTQLDTQFRMHPFLGDFVSEQFYVPHGEGFKSGLKDTELFRHDLPGTGNKPALWLNVPLSLGREERKETSWYRPREAESIAQKLSEWIDIEAPNGKKFSFGVISFYAAQTTALLEALHAKGICEKQDNELCVKEQYADRLEVGTVDAFQGKEFDIVFLSLVRSRNIGSIKIATGTFGHLLSPNRLCVSMSRQKKLLVVVGDKGLMQTDLAREQVPALYNFREICENGQEGLMV
jgi:hypothetical protein